MIDLGGAQEVDIVPTARWTMLGPPMEPTIALVRGVGHVRITQEDIDRYGQDFLKEDPELILERTIDDPDARYRITGMVPKVAPPQRKERSAQGRAVAAGSKPQRGGARGWLAKLFGG